MPTSRAPRSKRPKQRSVFGQAALTAQKAPVRQGVVRKPSGGRKNS